jgi:hypothetical protein
MMTLVKTRTLPGTVLCMANLGDSEEPFGIDSAEQSIVGPDSIELSNLNNVKIAGVDELTPEQFVRKIG